MEDQTQTTVEIIEEHSVTSVLSEKEVFLLTPRAVNLACCGLRDSNRIRPVLET